MKPMKYLAITIILVVLASCSSAPAAPTPDPTQVILNLAGQYVAQFTAEDLQQFSQEDPGIVNNMGVWLLDIQPNGNFSASLNGQFIASGNLGANGNELNIQVLRACETCACEGNIGRYVWTINEPGASGKETLSFKKIYDNCDVMAILLTAKPLLRK
jgi:hypothetical protein